MATTAPEPTAGGFRHDPDESAPEHDRPRGSRQSSRGGIGFLVTALVLAGLAGVAYASWQYGLIAPSKTQNQALTHTVGRSELLVTVTEDGNVESASNVEAKCEVAGGATILWIIPDGTEVEQGQEIVRLDQSTIEDQLNSQKIVYEKALATKIQAEEDFAAAKISVTEYVEGTYIQNVKDLEAQVTIALENLRSAENMLEHTQRMARKGFATPLQLEADEFAVQRANLELESAKTAKHVLEAFTREKTLKGLEATRDAAAARVRSEQAAVDLEKAKLDRLQEQLSKCVITAPQKGMVVYNNQQGGRFSQQQPQVEEGAAVRERQVLINLPDLSKMQVKVTVHESKVEQIHTGMPARIAIQDRQLKGRVVSVANQPEPTSFFQANVKEYATIVRIDGEQQGLKPGMTAEVEILIAQLEDALTLPVAAVVEQRGRFYCWVQTPEGPERRPLVLGLTNDTFIEIKDGVAEGEQVLLNPRAVVREAREAVPAADEQSIEDRFGTKTGDSGSGPAASGGPGPNRGPADGAASAAPAAPGGGAGAPEASGPGAGARRGGFDPMQFDTNKDGKLSKDEAPERMQQYFDRIDGNSDGVLDASELAQMRSRGGRGGQGGDSPGGGRPGAAPGGGPPGPPQTGRGGEP